MDLHGQLREMAKKVGADIHLNEEVTNIDCEGGLMMWQDGTMIGKELVVVADDSRVRIAILSMIRFSPKCWSLQSHFVKIVTGEKIETQKTGKWVYRMLVPFDELIADPITRPVFDGQQSGFIPCTIGQNGVMFIAYPCRNDEALNVVVFHSKKPHQAHAENWNSHATKDDVLETLDGFYTFWRHVLEYTDRADCFTVGHRDIVPRMDNAKVFSVSAGGESVVISILITVVTT